ncbi:MAG TPA: ABC transporter permease [Acholeplasmataceae bacterium]|nr:ABC transporter permease [Acholeplasmataceae bacterium]
MMLVPKRVKKNITNVGKWTFFGIVLLFLYFPLIYIFLQSFNASSTGSSFTGFTLKWYSEMFRDRALMDSIYITISIAIFATIISVILGTLFAIGINSLDKNRRKRMILLNNIPVLNADIVTGVFLMLTFQIVAFMFPGVKVFGYYTMLFSHVFFCIPYVILSVLPKLNEIDENLFDAALDLGCTPFGALRKVIIPSIKTGIITGALIAFTMSIDDFVISYMTTGHGVQNFSIWLFLIKNPFKNNAMQKAAAYNTLISITTILILVAYNLFRKKKGNGK